jgi:hypothetical protein
MIDSRVFFFTKFFRRRGNCQMKRMTSQEEMYCHGTLLLLFLLLSSCLSFSLSVWTSSLWNRQRKSLHRTVLLLLLLGIKEIFTFVSYRRLLRAGLSMDERESIGFICNFWLRFFIIIIFSNISLLFSSLLSMWSVVEWTGALLLHMKCGGELLHRGWKPKIKASWIALSNWPFYLSLFLSLRLVNYDVCCCVRIPQPLPNDNT